MDYIVKENVLKELVEARYRLAAIEEHVRNWGHYTKAINVMLRHNDCYNVDELVRKKIDKFGVEVHK